MREKLNYLYVDSQERSIALIKPIHYLSEKIDAVNIVRVWYGVEVEEDDKEWLGHSDFSTTANIYAHLDYSSKLSSAQAMVGGIPLPDAGGFKSKWSEMTDEAEAGITKSQE